MPLFTRVTNQTMIDGLTQSINDLGWEYAVINGTMHVYATNSGFPSFRVVCDGTEETLIRALQGALHHIAKQHETFATAWQGDWTK